MTLKIISAQEILFEGDASVVTLPGVNGKFSVLPRHAPLIAVLAEGQVRYVDGQTEKHIEVKGGLVDVENDVVSVCVY